MATPDSTMTKAQRGTPISGSSRTPLVRHKGKQMANPAAQAIQVQGHRSSAFMGVIDPSSWRTIQKIGELAACIRAGGFLTCARGHSAKEP